MKTTLLAIALSNSCLLAAVSFDTRVERAKRVEESLYGKEYVHSMWHQIDAQSTLAMRECFRQGSMPDTDAFVLVANVLPDGTLANFEVKPDTPMAMCYAKRLADAPFPTPPEIFGDTGIPIVVEMNIKP